MFRGFNVLLNYGIQILNKTLEMIKGMNAVSWFGEIALTISLKFPITRELPSEREIKSIRNKQFAISGNRLEYNLQCCDARVKRWSSPLIFSSAGARQSVGEPIATIPRQEKYFAYREKKAIMKRS